MSKLDDMAADWERRLNAQREKHRRRTEEVLEAMRQGLAGRLPPPAPEAVAALQGRALGRHMTPPAHGLLDLGGASWLNGLDNLFAETFHLARYADPARLAYPIVYCETLEEFFAPLVQQLDISSAARAEQLKQMMQEAQDMAHRTGGGIFGYNLPGVGCYLNGWLLAYGTNFSPRRALDEPTTKPRILAVAVHEKLGHGFLGVYSTLGQVKSRLGVYAREVAAQFGLRPAESATDKLREEQGRVLFLASQLLEEGWATWIEGFLPALAEGHPRRPSHRLDKVVAAVAALPPEVEDRDGVRDTLLTALTWLFGDGVPTAEQILQAVIVVEMTGGALDDYFGEALGQPLRYAVGELLLLQAEEHVGPLALPYLVLIAANVDPQPEKVGLSDMQVLMNSRPDMNPDARLAMLSRLQLSRLNDVAELARQAEETLSLVVPPALKGGER